MSELFRGTMAEGLVFTITTLKLATKYINEYATPDASGQFREPPQLYGKITDAAREMVKMLLRAQTQTDANALMAAKEDDAIAEILRRVRGE